MHRRVAVSLIAMVSVCALAQAAGTADNAQRAAASHGLTLTLTRDQTTESLETATPKNCLKDHPMRACIPLRYSLKNEGKESIIRWYSSCMDDFRSFEVQKADGSWEELNREFPICTRNVLEVQTLAPGDSISGTFRLADSYLGLDTSFPPDDGLLHMNRGYLLLAGPGTRTIRVRWSLQACVASDKLQPGVAPEPFSASRFCVGGVPPDTSQPWVILSNELELEADH